MKPRGMDLYLSTLFETVVLAHACYEISDSLSALEILPVIERGELLLANKALMQMRTHLPWPDYALLPCIGQPARAAVSLHTAV